MINKALSASTEHHPVSNSYWLERRRLAAELTELATQLLTRHIPENDISALANHLGDFNQKHKADKNIEGRLGWIEAGLLHGHDNLSVELSPLIGKSSCVGPAFKIWVENDEGRGIVNCDWRFEGPPKCVHGGYVAAIFDEFMGWTQMLSGGAGATKNLSVTYHKPTPLNVDLALKARMVSLDGRKIRVTGEMYAGDIMTASADALFISFGDKGTTELYKSL